MKRIRFKIAFTVILVLAGVSLAYFNSLLNHELVPSISTAGLFSEESPDHQVGRYTTIVDEQGNVLSMMSRTVYVGDELYTDEGRSYRVVKVEGDRAVAEFLGMDSQIVAYNEIYSGMEAPAMTSLAQQQSKRNIAVYHTHTAESYVPTDGREAIPFKGGIYQVGKAMVSKLQAVGLNVNYDETPHDPHDNNAYVRSRRTAASLIKQGPAAIFDVHRDGVPDPNFYRAEIAGQKVARLRIVVGRQNPRQDANMDFARRMLSAANNMHPRIVKEIFVGKGSFNQDLSATALLLEAGTHTNTREEAERGIGLFSESVPAVLGIAGAPPGAAAPQGADRAPAGGAWRAIGWILGLTLAGGVAFLLINAGNLDNAKKSLSGFGREITSFISTRSAALKPGMGDHDQDGDNK